MAVRKAIAGALSVAVAAATLVLVAAVPVAAAPADEPLEVNRFGHGDVERDLFFFMAPPPPPPAPQVPPVCLNEDGDPICTGDFQFPDSFLANALVIGMGVPYGNTPITACPAGQPCSVDVAKGLWLAAVSPESEDVALGTNHGDTTVTVTGPPGTVFSDDPADYVMADSDDAMRGRRFDQSPEHPDHVTRHADNVVELHVPVRHLHEGEDLYIWMADVTNPPGGTYSGFNFRFESSRQNRFPGHWGEEVVFEADDAVRRNSTLTTQQPVVTVGESGGLTATLRDAYGNPVPDSEVFIEPVNGSAGVVDDPDPVSDDSGEVTFRYTNHVAETVTFRALSADSSFIFFFDVQVRYVPAAPDPQFSSVAAVPTSVPADGSSTAEIIVRLSDRFQNPNDGDEIILLPQPVPGGPSGVFTDGVISAKPGYGCVAPVHPVPGVACATVDGEGNAEHQAEARFLVRTTTAEAVRFTVTDLTTGSPLAEFATVTFTATAPSDAALTPARQTVVADGLSTGTITASLRDAAGNPVPGVTVTLSATPGSDAVIADPTVATSSTGDATFTVRDASVETVDFTATYAGTVGGVPVNGAIEGAATVDFVPGPPVASSSITAAPSSRLADGTAAATVLVSLVDGGDRPAPGYGVVVIGNAGHRSTITPVLIPVGASACPTQAPAGTTDCNGDAAFSVVDSTVETVTYRASVPSEGLTLSGTATVSFTAAPGIDTTTIAASPQSVRADGAASSTITVVLRDADGAPLAGKDLCLTQHVGTTPGEPPCPDAASAPSDVTALTIPTAESSCPAPTAAGTTDCRGRARFRVTATTPATITYGIVDLTDFPDVPLGPTTSITFTAVPNEAGASSVWADVAVALANGGATDSGVATVTVTLRDGAGVPLVGHATALGQGGTTTATITPIAIPPSLSGCAAPAPAGTSDCHGETRFTVTDTTPEIVTLRATDATTGVTITETATVTFLPDEAAVSTVTADPAQVLADGGTTPSGIATVTVTLNPDLPLVGHQVVLLQSAGARSRIVATEVPVATSGCPVQRPAGVSDCNGTVRFTVTSPSVETVTYRAFDHTTGVLIDDTATVEFLDRPPVVTSISPSSGPPAGGTVVTVTGSRFATEPGQTTVTFGGVPAADVSCATATSCTATAPAGGPGPVPVVATTASGSSAAATFTYVIPAPTVTGVSPASGPPAGGTVVTVTGTNLHGASGVRFGTATVAVQSVDAAGTQVTAIAPAAPIGTVDVRVVTPGGTSATNAAARYTYQPADRCAGLTGLALLLCRLGL